MRTTLVAIAIGLVALVAAACNMPGADTDTLNSLAPLESTAPVQSDGLESTPPLASPSDMLESPASS